jgi:hypothetical protein
MQVSFGLCQRNQFETTELEITQKMRRTGTADYLASIVGQYTDCFA